MKPTFTIFNAVTHSTPYQREALRMLASLDRFGLPYLCTTYQRDKNWVKNCAAKARLIRQAREWISGPMVWLDADAEVMQYPTMFDLLAGSGADIAVRIKREGCLSGTVWIDDSVSARDLLDCWVERCEADPDTWDQKHLNPLRDKFAIHELPMEYVAIKGLDPWNTNTVIRHHQASRRFKQEMTV